MPLSYRIEDGIVYVEAVGAFDVREQMALTASWLEDPDLPTPHLVCRDGTHSDPPTPGDISDLIDYLSTLSFPPGSRLALVAGNDVNYGMSRMYQSWAADTENLEIAIFPDTAKALEWLRGGGG